MVRERAKGIPMPDVPPPWADCEARVWGWGSLSRCHLSSSLPLESQSQGPNLLEEGIAQQRGER